MDPHHLRRAHGDNEGKSGDVSDVFVFSIERLLQEGDQTFLRHAYILSREVARPSVGRRNRVAARVLKPKSRSNERQITYTANASERISPPSEWLPSILTTNALYLPPDVANRICLPTPSNGQSHPDPSQKSTSLARRMTGSSPTCDSSHNDMLINVNALTNFVLHVLVHWRTRWGAIVHTIKVREASHRLPWSPPVYQVCHWPVLHSTTPSNHREAPPL